MNKKLIRLTEADLHNIIKESVKRILKETIEQNQELEENQENEGLFGFGNKKPVRRSTPNTKAQLERDFNQVATQRNRQNNRIMKKAYDSGKISQDQYSQFRNPYSGKKMMYGESIEEAAYQGNHPGMDNGYGRFEMNHPEGKYSLYFDKAQRDAENYNAQQQGRTPKLFAGWSKRVNDGKGNWNDAEFNMDDMHMYNDDDASQTAANIRKYDPNGAYHWDMFRGHGDKFRQ